jgi:hypothetical protein
LRFFFACAAVGSLFACGVGLLLIFFAWMAVVCLWFYGVGLSLI